MVQFEIPEVLRRYSDGHALLELRGATVRQVLDALFAQFPPLRIRVLDAEGRLHPYLLLFLDGAELPRRVALLQPVKNGQTLELIGAAEGGSGAGEDVRMRGFRERTPVAEALRLALDGLTARPAEEVPVTACAGRVLAQDVVSAVNVPGFRRSAMDGYAVRAEDTHGASLYDPFPLELVGESLPGAASAAVVGRRQACRIMTGAPLPEGADAVLRAEDAQEEGTTVLAREAVPQGRHVGRIGEDIASGTLVLRAGRVLRPQDAGLLASIGHHPVRVVSRPRVRVMVSGNELLAPGETPSGTSIVDSNGPMLSALIERDGGLLTELLRVPDSQDALRDAVTRPGVDVIVAAGGSSVGKEDYLPMIVRDAGELVVHGISMRPASPTGFGRVGGVPVLLLPGNPVSCLCAYDFLAGPVIRRLAGRRAAWPHPRRELRLAQRLVSAIGRTDYARVEVRDGLAWPIAISGASVLSSTTRADGFVVIPAASEGVPEGGTVTVLFYDAHAPGDAWEPTP